MPLFGKAKYSFNRSTVTQAASKVLVKMSNAVAQLDNSDEPIGQRLENACAKLVNSDPDVQMILAKLTGKFEINVEMIIIPKFKDDNLMIESYILAVPNGQNTLVPAVTKANCSELIDYLYEISLTRDDDKAKAFVQALEKAVSTVVK